VGARRTPRRSRTRWEVDHILPVAAGGGECDLENLRLLCRACHVIVTASWRRALADAERLYRSRMATASVPTAQTAPPGLEYIARSTKSGASDGPTLSTSAPNRRPAEDGKADATGTVKRRRAPAA
jgi:hypothetical protein